MICSRCKKRMAVVYVSRQENGQTINEGLCLKCAKELNIPQIKEMTEKMGITDDDIERIAIDIIERFNKIDKDSISNNTNRMKNICRDTWENIIFS